MSRREVNRSDEKGTRLLPTADAIIGHVVAPNDRGTLCGFGRHPDLIRVRRDGLKTVNSYHKKFWRRAQTQAEKAIL